VPIDDVRELLRGLDRRQRQAVTHADGPLLVVAGPGTGKTEVITRRVAWLIASKRARPSEILALTFTERAVEEMQARVDLLVPYGQADTAIHTFHAFGDWLLHPKGYHHILAGAERDAVNTALEVDHVMGCFYCCKRTVYDDVGGYDESILRGQTIDFGLAARLKGWACWAIPQIEYIHRHGLRGARSTTADTHQGVQQTLDTFRDKWGFDRIAPDLDVVRAKYNGSPLLWNAQVFGTPPSSPTEATQASRHTEPLPIEQSHWSTYANNPAFKQAYDLRILIALKVMEQVGKPETTAVIGCDAGLSTHLLAGQGLACLATDTDPAKIALANQCIQNQAYPSTRPQYTHQADPGTLPLSDGVADMALVVDQLETHRNPVGLLRETHRVVKEGGTLVIMTKRPSEARTPQEHDRCYNPQELVTQVAASGGWQPSSDPNAGDPSHPMILIAKRVARPEAPAEGAGKAEAA